MYSILPLGFDTTVKKQPLQGIVPDCDFYNQVQRIKQDVNTLFDTYLDTRWVNARNDVVCQNTKELRVVYNQIIKLIELDSPGIRDAMGKLARLLEIPYFILRSVFRERYWNSKHFRQVLNEQVWIRLGLYFVMKEHDRTIPASTQLFSTMSYMNFYPSVLPSQKIRMPCCVSLGVDTLELLVRCADRTVFLADTRGNIIDVGQSAAELYTKFFDYFHVQIAESQSRSFFSFSWLRSCCSSRDIVNDQTLTLVSPVAILCKMVASQERTAMFDSLSESTLESTIDLAYRYYEITSPDVQELVTHKIICEIMPRSSSNNAIAYMYHKFSDAIRRHIQTFFNFHYSVGSSGCALLPAVNTVKEIEHDVLDKPSYYQLMLTDRLINLDQLSVFVIETLKRNGYENAVSFILPLIDTNLNINPRYFLYFLSELIKITKKRTDVIDYFKRVIKRVNAICDANSHLYNDYVQICEGYHHKPISMVYNQSHERVLTTSKFLTGTPIKPPTELNDFSNNDDLKSMSYHRVTSVTSRKELSDEEEKISLISANGTSFVESDDDIIDIETERLLTDDEIDS
jgi:hypothetical protein